MIPIRVPTNETYTGRLFLTKKYAYVRVGMTVDHGTLLFDLEDDKIIHEITAPFAGIITTVEVIPEYATLEPGQQLLSMKRIERKAGEAK